MTNFRSKYVGPSKAERRKARQALRRVEDYVASGALDNGRKKATLADRQMAALHDTLDRLPENVENFYYDNDEAFDNLSSAIADEVKAGTFKLKNGVKAARDYYDDHSEGVEI